MSSDVIRRLSIKEGCRMESELCWEVFCATGEPMAYLLFKAAGEDTPA